MTKYILCEFRGGASYVVPRKIYSGEVFIAIMFVYSAMKNKGRREPVFDVEA